MRRGELFGHPRGLAYLLAAEAFERFSYYGMQSLLVLYMAGYLLRPDIVAQVRGFAAFRAVVESVTGRLSDQALATQIFGLYTGLVYLTPVLGGWIGDRVVGRRRAVVIGLCLMAAGHFLMASAAAFLLALAVLISGSALLKGNVAAQVGALYAADDSRRDRAYTVLYTAINGGSMLAPLVCGTLGEVYGWHYGFGAAGVFMLVGLGAYLRGLRFMPPDDAAAPVVNVAAGGGLAWGRAAACGLIMVAAALFWVAVSQGWNTYVLWVRDHVDRVAFGHVIPVTWFASFDAATGLAAAVPVLAFWRWQQRRGREPDELRKIAWGCLLYAAALVWLALGPVVMAGGKVSVLWVVAFSGFTSVGYLYAAPVFVAVVARAVPGHLSGTAIAVYYTSIFAGSLGSGWLSRYYEVMGGAAFWAMHAGICGAGGVLLWIVGPQAGRWLHDATIQASGTRD